MTISELHNRLKENGINDDQFFLHGHFSSKDNNDKIALTIRKGQNGIEYEIYHKERGEKQ